MKINKVVMKQIIREFQETPLPDVLPRDLDLPLKPEKIIALTGPRRSGKTYLLYGQIKKLLAEGIPIERIIYLNLEDPRLRPLDPSGFELFLEAYRELYSEQFNSAQSKRAKLYLFLDEVQAALDWERAVRRLYETRYFHIYVTGSSSALLSYDIATELRGRALTYELFPFSFCEFLKARGLKLDKFNEFSGARFSVAQAFDEYLLYGGFPEVVLTDSDDLKFRILQSYLETMFLRDIVERYQIRNQLVMRELVRHLGVNVATPFSVNAFYRWIKTTYPITKRTIITYLKYLDDSRLFLLLTRFSFSLKEQALSPKKIYLIDVGLKEVFSFGADRDIGKKLENIVVVELARRRAKNPRLNVFYWKDAHKREVDCVLTEKDKVIELIQVCAYISDFKVKERELKALKAAAEELKCNNLKIITMEEEGEEAVGLKKVKIIPAWKWLITPNKLSG